MRNRCNLRAAGLVVCCATLAVVLSACGPAAQSADSTRIDLPPLALDPLLDTQPSQLADRRVQEQLNKTIPAIDFAQMKFEDCLNFLRDNEHVNINPDWGDMKPEGVTNTTEINLQLRNVPFRVVLRELLNKAAGRENVLDYIIRDGVIKVSSAADLAMLKYIVLYDIRDLLARLESGRQVTGPPDINGAQVTRTESEENHKEVINVFQDLLRTLCIPDSWAPTGDASIKELAGMLVIKQTSKGHREVAKLLQQLREKLAAAERAAPAKPWPGYLSVPLYHEPSIIGEPGGTGKWEPVTTRPD